MINSLERKAIRFLQGRGFTVRPPGSLDDPVQRRLKLLSSYTTNLVLDVGANAGQYALELRKNGYSGKIVSFEPLTEAYSRLAFAAGSDPDWQAVRLGLGDRECDVTIHVAGNSYSSSILDMLPRHASSAPESEYVASEQISLRRLDSVFGQYCTDGDRIWLKIDVQGYEKHVLNGADRCLQRIDTIQLELSLVPLYLGAPAWMEMCDYLLVRRYELVSVEPGFSDERTGQLLQLDGVFHRPPIRD